MNDADNPSSELRINPTALPFGSCAVAQPIVRSVSIVLGRHYWLQLCERQDFATDAWMRKLVWKEAGREHGVEYLGLLQFDRGAALTLPHWRQLLERLELLRVDIGLHIVLVGHAKAERTAIERPGGSISMIERQVPELFHRQVSVLIQDWCDEVLFGEPVDTAAHGAAASIEARILHTMPSASHLAKYRLHLPARLPLQLAALTPYLATDQLTDSPPIKSSPLPPPHSKKGYLN